MAHEFGQFILAIDGSALPARATIGGKAWSIAHMRSLDLPVPPAVVITTAVCHVYLESAALPKGLEAELDAAIAWLESATGRGFGASDRPLLVSVRSGAAISMPGMMDTVLNLGINDTTERALAAESGDDAFARDTHRRFLELYASIVLRLRQTLPDLGDGDPRVLRAAIGKLSAGKIPEDPRMQLSAAIEAVFASWNSRRAKHYRKHHGIEDSLGTAVTVQSMVFGNLDVRSGTGVLFSRNPLTGDTAPYGEYLHCAQGEDVVSGKFTPEPLSALAEVLPEIYDQLVRAARTLEDANNDVQDIEFTVQQGQLFLLQTRSAKRAPQAAVRCAVEMVDEGRIEPATALSRVTADQVRSLLKPRLAQRAEEGARVLARGEPACQGVGRGVVVVDSDEAEILHAAGKDVVLARATTSPEDVHGIIASQAVITERGGSTSHAALVSRDLGKPSIVGCGDGSVTALVGEMVTVDANEGRVFAGELDMISPSEADDPCLRQLADWAEQACPLRVFDVNVAVEHELLDLDGIVGAEDPEKLPGLLNGCRAVRGGAIETDAGVKAALSCGVESIHARHPLVVMLAAIHARAGSVDD